MNDCRWLYVSIVIISLLGSSSSSRALSCREQVRAGAEDPISCARVTRDDLRLPSLNPDDDWKTPQKVNDQNNGITYDTILNMWVSGSTGGTIGTVGATVADQNKDFDPMKLPGVCRWDYERSNRLGNSQACMCPVETEDDCTGISGTQCWWYEFEDDNSKECLNNAERFYYLLEKLLKKRGKNDFAIRIKYAGSPKNALMPTGLLGKIMMVNMMSQMMGNPFNLATTGNYGYSSQYNNQYNNQYNYDQQQNYYNYAQQQNDSQTIPPQQQYGSQYPQYQYPQYSQYQQYQYPQYYQSSYPGQSQYTGYNSYNPQNQGSNNQNSNTAATFG